MSLSDDLLWTIFMHNATDPGVEVQDRLTSTRLTSQVCAHWRQLILESASIWAKLIWIDHEKKKEWTQEILTRAGSSLLLWVHVRWIVQHGVVTTPIPLLLDIIFTQCWNRVEVFHASIDDKNTFLWRYLERPAPRLRSFDIIVIATHRVPASTLEGSTKCLPTNLFANHAPLLNSVSCPYFCINHNPPWLSQIDTLAMSTASFEMLLDIVESTPRLRILRVYLAPSAPQISDAQCARLASMSTFIIPRLATFDMGTINIEMYTPRAMFYMADMNIQVFNALWFTKSKSPAESRTFQQINWGGTPDGIEERIFHHTFDNMLHHHAFPARDPQDMDWSLSIEDESISTLAFNISSFTSKLNLGLCFFNIPSNKRDAILRHLNPYAGYIRRFSLYILNSNTALVDLHPLMLNLRSISVTMTVLEWCNRLQDSKGPLFHMLAMINLEDEFQLTPNGYERSLVGFLERRQNVGWALPAVHFHEDPYFMSFVCDTLDRFVGLRVIWTWHKEYRVEYVCGLLEQIV